LNNPPNLSEVGHFTQLVWRNSKRVGFGFAKTGNSKGMIVVANYDPAGNYKGQYRANVARII